MTPNLELLKKIQPLFTEWNVGDRGINKGGTFIYIREENSIPKLPSDGHRIIFIDGRCNTIIPYSQWRNALHYPYPHQMWDKVDWEHENIFVNTDGQVRTHSCDGEYYDPETALLKALVWQMENKKCKKERP